MFGTGAGMHTGNHRHGGLTVIELLLVVAILGIVVAIALPAYTDYRDRMNV
jgi:type IV pilus assembly protein PilA